MAKVKITSKKTKPASTSKSQPTSSKKQTKKPFQEQIYDVFCELCASNEKGTNSTSHQKVSRRMVDLFENEMRENGDLAEDGGLDDDDQVANYSQKVRDELKELLKLGIIENTNKKRAGKFLKNMNGQLEVKIENYYGAGIEELGNRVGNLSVNLAADEDLEEAADSPSLTDEEPQRQRSTNGSQFAESEKENEDIESTTGDLDKIEAKHSNTKELMEEDQILSNPIEASTVDPHFAQEDQNFLNESESESNSKSKNSEADSSESSFIVGRKNKRRAIQKMPATPPKKRAVRKPKLDANRRKSVELKFQAAVTKYKNRAKEYEKQMVFFRMVFEREQKIKFEKTNAALRNKLEKYYIELHGHAPTEEEVKKAVEDMKLEKAVKLYEANKKLAEHELKETQNETDESREKELQEAQEESQGFKTQDFVDLELSDEVKPVPGMNPGVPVAASSNSKATDLVENKENIDRENMQQLIKETHQSMKEKRFTRSQNKVQSDLEKEQLVNAWDEEQSSDGEKRVTRSSQKKREETAGTGDCKSQ